MKVWKLKKGHDARIRSGHPWVFSNDLMDSPKSIKPGEPIELHDFKSHFLARGYGNPHSLIAFRAVEFKPNDETPLSVDSLAKKLITAWETRYQLGFKTSFRLCFSEADQMPGLICDRYLVKNNNNEFAQVFSYQLLTAGMDLAFQQSEKELEIFKSVTEQAVKLGVSNIPWQKTILLQRNDVNIRKLEGLTVAQPKTLKVVEGFDLNDLHIVVQNVFNSEQMVFFQVNLIEGQKTGFFLDQTFNMKLVVEVLSQKKEFLKNKKIKLIDLCCYMGQWSSQIVANLSQWGIECEVHLVDVSALALEKAKLNLSNYKVDIHTHKMDVLEGLPSFPQHEFDIVISDPPAFVKNRKDLPQGLHAYYKLNAQAFRIAKPGGLVATCTCSGLVTMDDFKESLRKAILKSGHKAQCLLTGGQGWDHPTLMSFPEGQYLKMVLHQVVEVR